MLTISVEISDEQAKRLAAMAERFNLSVEELAAASLRELLAKPDRVEDIVNRVLEKNAKLEKPAGMSNDKTRGTRNAYCSFCRRPHTETGPLAEGPGHVFICYGCLVLCKELISKECERRNIEPHRLTLEHRPRSV